MFWFRKDPSLPPKQKPLTRKQVIQAWHDMVAKAGLLYGEDLKGLDDDIKRSKSNRVLERFLRKLDTYLDSDEP